MDFDVSHNLIFLGYLKTSAYIFTSLNMQNETATWANNVLNFEGYAPIFQDDFGVNTNRYAIKRWDYYTQVDENRIIGYALCESKSNILM